MMHVSRFMQAVRWSRARREFLQRGSWLFGGLLAGRASAPAGAAMLTPMSGTDLPAALGQSVSPAAMTSVYEALGVRPLINGRGTVTVIGATRTLPEVKAAMEAAAREFVQ